MLRFPIFLLLFGVFSLTSCEEETIAATDFSLGYDYYPLEVGKYISYQVDSILYDPTDGRIIRDSSSIQMREAVVASFEDEKGQKVFTIERSERESEANEWEIKHVYSTYRTDLQVVRQEENLSFLKMIFPLDRGTNWDALGFDPTLIISVAGESVELFKNWESIVTDVDEPLSIGNFSFDEVSTIELARDTNSIELRSAFEQYAKGIGLIYKEISILNTQNIGAEDNVLWEDKAEQGFLMYQKVIDYN